MRRTGAVWVLAGFALTITIGLRYQVGADWNNYLEQFADIPSWELVEVLGDDDPGYMLLNWFAGRNELGIWFVNTVCGGIFSYGLIAFARSQPRPWLALAVAVPYLIIVVAMGYTRQAAAIGFVMLGLVRLGKGSFVRFALCIALAATFHKTATLLLPLAALSATKSRLWTAIWSVAAFAVLYSTFLEKKVDRLIQNYVEAEYQSEGAAIRVAMNALPAIVFLLNRSRFALERQERETVDLHIPHLIRRRRRPRPYAFVNRRRPACALRHSHPAFCVVAAARCDRPGKVRDHRFRLCHLFKPCAGHVAPVRRALCVLATVSALSSRLRSHLRLPSAPIVA